MFGYKIIHKNELEAMHKRIMSDEEVIQNLLRENTKLEKDCCSLRIQLNENMNKVKDLQEKLHISFKPKSKKKTVKSE